MEDVTSKQVEHAVSTSKQSPSPVPKIETRYKRQHGIVRSLCLDQISVYGSRQYRESYMNQHIHDCDRMYSTNVYGHHGCVNALAFSPNEEHFLATGGDDQRVLIWRMADVIQGREKLSPIEMITRHRSNIFTLDFSCDTSFIFSGGEDSELIKHDFRTRQFVNSYEHLEAVYSVATHPSSPEVILTASEDGCVYIIDSRLPRRELGHDMLLCEDIDSYQCVAINPVEPRLVGVCNARNGSSLYDTRNRKQILTYKSTNSRVYHDDGVSICFNGTGTKVFSMYRRHAPTLHNLWDEQALCYYSDVNGAYRNCVTMKSGCFMGQNDEFVVSGSDDFRIYIWKVPTEANEPVTHKDTLLPSICSEKTQNNPHLVLPGHRSIVNQARYSRVHRVLASSGVEKVIKIWSDFPLNGQNTVHQSRDPPARKHYTQLELDMMMTTSSPLDPSDPSQEDQKVLALFDNLVQDDIDADSVSWNNCDSDDSIDPLTQFQFWRELPFFDTSDDEFGLTPLELSPANTSSLEPPWSDTFPEDLDDDMYGGRDLWNTNEEGGEEEEEEEWEEEEEGDTFDLNSQSEDADDEGDGEWRRYRGNSEERTNSMSSENEKVKRKKTENSDDSCATSRGENSVTEPDPVVDRTREKQTNGTELPQTNGGIARTPTRGSLQDPEACYIKPSVGIASASQRDCGVHENGAEGEGCSKSKSKRKKLVKLRANQASGGINFSQYTLEDFLKAKPSSSFYSSSNSNS